MRIKILAIVLAFVPTASAWAITSTSVSFQRGVGAYDSNTEIRISGDSTTSSADGTNGLSSQRYAIDGWDNDDPLTTTVELYSPDAQELIKFGNVFNNPSASETGPIPMGATILDAQLTYTTGNSTNDISPGPWGVAALLQPFTTATRYTDFPATTATNDSQKNSHGAWFQDINSATNQPYATRPVGAFAGPNSAGPPILGANVLNGVTNADVFGIVQKWSDGLANNGMVIQAGWTGQSNGWGFYNIGNTSNIAFRPKLSVTYTTDPIIKTTIQRGLNSYDGNTVARLASGPLADATDDVTTDGSITTSALYIDGQVSAPGDVFADLMKFTSVFGTNDGQAPVGKPVAKAWLVLTTGTGNDHRSPGPFSVHKMLRDWDLTTKYSDIGATPGLQEADADMGPTLDINYGATNGAESWFDITSYLEAVRTGAEDKGLAIVPETNDGWAIMMNGATDTTVRPRLVIYSDNASVPAGVAGDYNGSGTVDAADYVLWRHNVAPLSNEGDTSGGAGVTNAADYTYWRSRFGATSGAGAGGAVPEPTAMFLALMATLALSLSTSRNR